MDNQIENQPSTYDISRWEAITPPTPQAKPPVPRATPRPVGAAPAPTAAPPVATAFAPPQPVQPMPTAQNDPVLGPSMEPQPKTKAIPLDENEWMSYAEARQHTAQMAAVRMPAPVPESPIPDRPLPDLGPLYKNETPAPAATPPLTVANDYRNPVRTTGRALGYAAASIGIVGITSIFVAEWSLVSLLLAADLPLLLFFGWLVVMAFFGYLGSAASANNKVAGGVILLMCSVINFAITVFSELGNTVMASNMSVLLSALLVPSGILFLFAAILVFSSRNKKV